MDHIRALKIIGLDFAVEVGVSIENTAHGDQRGTRVGRAIGSHFKRIAELAAEHLCQDKFGKVFKVLVKGHLTIVGLRVGIGNFGAVFVENVFKLARQLTRCLRPSKDDILTVQRFHCRTEHGVHPEDLDALGNRI